MAVLSERSSFISTMYFPARILSTSLAGMGGSDEAKISGAVEVAGVVDHVVVRPPMTTLRLCWRMALPS